MDEVEHTSSVGSSPENSSQGESLENGLLNSKSFEQRTSNDLPHVTPHVTSARSIPTRVDQADLTDQQIGRYLIKRRLGSGGAATVYQAFDQVSLQSVALKILSQTADESALMRFRREALMSGALRHPHIVRTIQVGVAPHGDVAYMAMELIEGDSLRDLLDQVNWLHPEESCGLLAPIASALAHAHQSGIVHRDVKPSNILLRPSPHDHADNVYLETLHHPVIPMLSDFGIARSLDAPDLTASGRTVGTPAYMSPEQCTRSRHTDGRADIYSLGAVLFHCIVGRRPFSGTTTQLLHAHVYEPLTIEDDVLHRLSPLVVEILQRSMAKSPDDRYTNADDMADALTLASGKTLPLFAEVNEGDSDITGTMTMSSMPLSPVEVQPPRTVLIQGKWTQDPRSTPRTAPDHIPPPALVDGTLNLEHDIPASQQSLLDRLEQFAWGRLAFVIIAVLLSAIIGATVFRSAFFQSEPNPAGVVDPIETKIDSQDDVVPSTTTLVVIAHTPTNNGTIGIREEHAPISTNTLVATVPGVLIQLTESATPTLPPMMTPTSFPRATFIVPILTSTSRPAPPTIEFTPTWTPLPNIDPNAPTVSITETPTITVTSSTTTTPTTESASPTSTTPTATRVEPTPTWTPIGR
ncbi:serine/threonine protein kinase [Chloroflexi bacterium TSY]|nr:serine/threonine protein kinase [Chloroflexi bacterium TSY]